MFFRCNTEFVVESVMPDLLHIVPVCVNTVFNGIFQSEDQWTLHKTYMESYLQSNNPAHMMNPYLARNGFSYPMTTTVGWSYPTFPSLWTGFKTEIAGGPRSKSPASVICKLVFSM